MGAGNGGVGDYGWSMDFDTSQGIVAVEYGRVLEYIYINSSAVGAHARKYKKPPSSRLQQNTKQKINS